MYFCERAFKGVHLADHLLEESEVIWSHLESSGAIWSHLVEPSEAIWCHLETSGVIWRHLESSAVIWNHLESSGVIWSHLEASGVIWRHLESSGVICSHLESSGVVWSHLQASGVTWRHMESSEGIGIIWRHLESPRKLPGDTQEAPRRHPKDTQETLRMHPGSTQEHPGAPRSTQEHQGAPRSTQETPRRHRGFFAHAWRNIAQRADAQSVSDGPIVSDLTPLMGSRTSVPGTSIPAASVNDRQQPQKRLRNIKRDTSGRDAEKRNAQSVGATRKARTHLVLNKEKRQARKQTRRL